MRRRRKKYRRHKVEAPRCMHCRAECEFHQKSDHVYGKNYGPIWQCPVCTESICGCHKGTKLALGRPANKETRQKRLALHSRFDPFWKSGKFQRSAAYRCLADLMGVTKDRCHFSLFSIGDCDQALLFIESGELLTELIAYSGTRAVQA